jgi:PHD/YefM family antitoxin component YafN of YafNO toxin-antitoxin module
MAIHPQVIERKGKKEFVVLPYEEFLSVQEALGDFEDLKELRKEKEKSKSEPTTPLDEVTKNLGL